MAYAIRPLDKAVDTGGFRCGQPQLDDYLCRYAAQDQRRGGARVFVATPGSDARHLAGFFSLSAGSVSCADLPQEMARKLPRYPVPVALLGRLAVDQAYHGQGLGAILLSDACQKVVQASRVLAVAALVVDAKGRRSSQVLPALRLRIPGGTTGSAAVALDSLAQACATRERSLIPLPCQLQVTSACKPTPSATLLTRHDSLDAKPVAWAHRVGALPPPTTLRHDARHPGDGDTLVEDTSDTWVV